MKQEKILDALNMLDDEMVQEVERLRVRSVQSKKRKFPAVWGGLVAAGVLIVAVAGLGDRTGGISDTASRESLTVGEAETTQADMLAFFIHQGNMYEQYDFIETEALLGEYVGTASGEIDEWSGEDAYVESAGSVAGNYYEVEGFDPSFILGMEQSDGSISIYMNTTMDLEQGAELYEEMLRLEDQYVDVQYQTREDWYYSNGEPEELPDEYADTISTFIGGLNDGEFVELTSMLSEEEGGDIYEKEIYHLFFQLENGMTVHLRLFEDGYVALRGMYEEGVRMDETIFNEMIQVLEEVQ